MAIAAIAAPPMASTNFQSASNSFNGKTPYSQMGGSAPGWKSRAHAMRRNCFLHPPMPHSCVFYRNHGACVNLRLWRVHRIAQHANTGNADLHGIPRNQRPDPGGGAG